MERLGYSLPQEKKLIVVGPAICDWQNHPEHDQSEWGDEVKRKLEGKPSRIQGSFTREDLPRFHEEYGKVLERSTEIGSNAFRTSFDFAELCPKPGVFNKKLMAHYVRILARCHFLGMEPIVTFHHWTHPKSFAKYKNGEMTHGALEHPDIIDHFAFYVNRVANFLFDPQKIRNAVKDEGYPAEFVEKLCDERLICRWFVSLNEPVNMSFTNNVVGALPPYKWGRFDTYDQAVEKLKVMHRIVHQDVHDRVISDPRLLHEHDHVKVGMTHQLTTHHVPIADNLSNWGLMERMEERSNSDFIGLQYYFGIRFARILQALPLIFKGINPMKGPDRRYHSDYPECPEIYPAGLYDILKETQRRHPNKKLLVGEVGWADDSGLRRPDWILETVYHLIRARREGINVSGMLIWTIVNNLEWVKGMNIPNGIFGAHTERLPIDPQCVSSEQALKEGFQHLINPTPESAQRLSDLQVQTRKQLDSFAS